MPEVMETNVTYAGLAKRFVELFNHEKQVSAGLDGPSICEQREQLS